MAVIGIELYFSVLTRAPRTKWGMVLATVWLCMQSWVVGEGHEKSAHKGTHHRATHPLTDPTLL